MAKKPLIHFSPGYPGQDFTRVPDITLPDQSISLQEILDRFTRNEPLPVDMGGEYGDDDLDNPLNIDLEKMARADLTDRMEYYNALEQLKKRYKQQESEEEKKRREDEDRAKELEMERAIRAKIAAEGGKSA